MVDGLISKTACLTALGLALALGLCAAAQAQFGPVTTVTEPGINGSYPEVGFDGDDTAVAVWAQRRGFGAFRVAAAIRPAGGDFSAPEILSGEFRTYFTEPSLAVSPSGTAVAAWSAEDVVQAAVREPGGAFGTAIDLSVPGLLARDAKAAVDADGNALVVWKEWRAGDTLAVIKAAYRPAGASFGTPDVISDPAGFAAPPAVAFDAEGNATVVWERAGFGTPAGSALMTAYRPAAGAFGAPVAITAEPVLYALGMHAPELDVDAAGNALVTFFGGFSLGQAGMWSSFRPAGGTFSAPERFSDRWAHSAQALDADGNAVIVTHIGDFSSVVSSVSRPVAGPLEAPLPLAAPGSAFQGEPAVEFNAGGDAFAVWSTGRGIRGALRPAGGTFGYAGELPGASPGSWPDVAIDSQGNALVIWNTPGSGEGWEGTLAAAFGKPQLSPEPEEPTTGPFPWPTPIPTPTPTASPEPPQVVNAGEESPPAKPLKASISAKSRQRGARAIAVVVGCPHARCVAQAGGTIAVPKARKASLAATQREIAAGARATLRVKLSPATRTAVKRALRTRKSIAAKVSVTVAGGDGLSQRRTLSVRLTR